MRVSVYVRIGYHREEAIWDSASYIAGSKHASRHPAFLQNGDGLGWLARRCWCVSINDEYAVVYIMSEAETVWDN